MCCAEVPAALRAPQGATSRAFRGHPRLAGAMKLFVEPRDRDTRSGQALTDPRVDPRLDHMLVKGAPDPNLLRVGRGGRCSKWGVAAIDAPAKLAPLLNVS